jgi:hypothetical protein
MNKRERCIMSVKAKNVERGCTSNSRLGTKKCPNPFAVCSRVGTRAKVADPELAEAADALRHTVEA